MNKGAQISTQLATTNQLNLMTSGSIIGAEPSLAERLAKTPACGIQLVHTQAKQPVRATTGSAGLDIFAAEANIVPAHGKCVISAGFRIVLSLGTYAQLLSRSSLTLKGITVEAGVIDSDYPDIVKVVLYNHSDENFGVAVGDRIAQMVIHRHEPGPAWLIKSNEEYWVAAAYNKSGRTGGFGSTGK
jgi:dUTP pyrophosphatase